MKIHFEQFGTGTPIELLHAFPLSNQMWKPQIEAIISNNFRLILPDFRGFGESPLEEDSSLEDFAKDINEMLNDLKIEKAIIGGLSMGGYVLFNLYYLFPSRFSAMILMDTTSKADTDEKRNNRLKLIQEIKIKGSEALLDKFLLNLTGNFTKTSNQNLIQDLENSVAKVPAETTINALRAMANRKDHTDILPQINIPTLLLFGEDDTLFSKDETTEMASKIKNSQLTFINKAGHLVNLEQSESFNTELLNFINSVKNLNA